MNTIGFRFMDKNTCRKKPTNTLAIPVSTFVFYRRKKVMQILNNMSVNKRWQNLNFGWTVTIRRFNFLFHPLGYHSVNCKLIFLFQEIERFSFSHLDPPLLISYKMSTETNIFILITSSSKMDLQISVFLLLILFTAGTNSVCNVFK